MKGNDQFSSLCYSCFVIVLLAAFYLIEPISTEVIPRPRGRGGGYHATPRCTGPYSTRHRTRSARITTPPPPLVAATNGTPTTNGTGPSTPGLHVAKRGLEGFIDLARSIVHEERAMAHNPTSFVTTVAESLTLTNTMVHSRPLPSPSIVSPLHGLPLAPLPTLAGTSILLTAGECGRTGVRTRLRVVSLGAHVC